MPVYDYDGSAQRTIGTIYDNNGSTNSQIKTGHDYDGTASRIVYELDETVYLYKNGVTGEVYTGNWVGSGICHVKTNTTSIIGTYGRNPATFYDSAGVLYIDDSNECSGGMRTSQWIPWTGFQGKTCYCDAIIYTRAWGFDEYKWDKRFPYLDVSIWTASTVNVGSAALAVSTQWFSSPPPTDYYGRTFDGTGSTSILYEWRLTLSFKVPSSNGWLFFTMTHGVPTYAQIRTSTIYIK